MVIIKGLAVVGYALVMLLVLTGGRSANEAEFNAGHQACDAQFNMDAMQAFEMDCNPPIYNRLGFNRSLQHTKIIN